MIARAVASETRRVVCSTCGEGAISGGPGYLVKIGRGQEPETSAYAHGDARTCAYVIGKRVEERKKRNALVRLWFAIRDLVGR